ncbi:DNA primase [Candidatus Uhrbacteria bacterium]|nr:DNA primase [Candidatus Uhrbacteria bacterium]
MADTVQEIKSRLGILDVIRDDMQLKPAGSSWKGLCPFHHEKTPSFFVSPDRQVWHCFGCGEGGDLFAFVMKRQGLEFREALEMLATRAGVTIEHYDPRRMSQKSALFEILQVAQELYTKMLLSPEGVGAREYLGSRGITTEVIDRWGIGYAPDAWDRMSLELIRRKYRAEDIRTSGLVVPRKAEQKRHLDSLPFYDRFRNRILFPIRDLQGRTVGFGGRVMPVTSPSPSPTRRGESEHDEPKYINTPETPIYEKSKILFALDRARHDIRTKDFAIIVEGYMDALTAHEAGYTNVVATSGTAMTAEHVQIVKRFTENVALSFDEDAAGRAAVERGIDAALAAGMNVSVLSIPNGKDPDECIRHDPALWEAAVRNRQPFLDYIVDRTIAACDLTTVEGKKKAAKTILTAIAKLTNPIEATHYLQKLGNLVQVHEDILRSALTKSAGAKATTPPQASPHIAPEIRSRIIRAAERILGFLLKDRRTLTRVISRLTPAMFSDPRGVALYKALVSFYTQEATRDTPDFFSFDAFIAAYPEGKTYGNELLLRIEQEFPTMTDALVETEVRGNLVVLERAWIQSQLASITRTLALREQAAADDQESIRLMQEFTRLSEMLQHLDRDQ